MAPQSRSYPVNDDLEVNAASGVVDGDSLILIASVEQSKFETPVPGSARDTRNLGLAKPTKFQSMVAQASGKGKDDGMGDDDDEDDEDGDGDGDGEGDDDDDGEDEGARPRKRKRKRRYANKRNATSTGRRKIDIEYIDDKAKRHVSFTKRKQGLMKKAFELSTLTGTNCLVLVVSESGLVYHYATPGFEGMVEHRLGKELIAASLKGELTSDDNDNRDPVASISKAIATNNTSNNARANQNQSRTSSAPTPIAGPSGSTSKTNGARRTSASSSTAPDNIMVDGSSSRNATAYTSNAHASTSSAALQRVRSSPEEGVVDPALNGMLGISHLFQPFSNGDPPSMVELVQQSLPPLAFPAHSESHTYSLPPLGRPIVPGAQSTVQTPFERALGEHVPALALFRDQAERERSKNLLQGLSIAASRGTPSASMEAPAALASRTSWYGPQDLQEAAKGWKGPIPVSVRRASDTIAETLLNAYDSTSGGGSGGGCVAQAEAEQALVSAREMRTVSSFVVAYLAAIRRNGSLLPATEATLKALGEWVIETGIESAEYVDLAVKTFLTHTAISTSCINYDKTRQHLLTWFDFLRDRQLIATDVYDALSFFHDLPREAELAYGIKKWIEQLERRYSSQELGAMRKVSGAFEVYRVRGNYVLLRGKSLKGDEEELRYLSPFKVRLPREMTAKLEIEYEVTLSINQIQASEANHHKPHWIPTAFHSIETSSNADNVESDIEPDMYREELSRLLAAAPEKGEHEDKIKFTRDVIALLERAKELLRQGDLDD
ncbi:BQ2448_7073 [Microbotryum intermedium]|uniref:BQ2448_7073 protein n=1 Tax=Microbotryum intermedium TaxID=269621 RepID=A0A238FPL6_9BASI|nr:BQ2448_7073 [Microbotryum intermedium]